MIKYYNKGGIYVAIHSKGEICVFLNEQITLTEHDPTRFCVENDYSQITHLHFCKAYDKTLKFITEQYSRLNMMYTDANIEQATEADKVEGREDIFEKLLEIFRPVHEAKEFEL